MATNPYVNKVELTDGTVLMDSTATTVTPDKLMNGITAIDKTGATITGTLEIPVTSVNGKTGAVVLTASDVGALADNTVIPSATSDLTNDSGFITVSDIPKATDSVSGTVKTNSANGIQLNSNGQLEVTGRLGQMSNTTGLYSPVTINPYSVGNGSFLLTEASGTTLENKSLAVSTGSSLSLKSSAAAGATQYRVSNTYENRIICAGIVGGRLALNESSAANKTVRVTGVKINGSDFTPNSSSITSTDDIVITTEETVNPNSSTSSVRPYSKGGGFSNLFVGQQIGSGTSGASVIVGQKVFSVSGNACVLVGASIYNSGNGNAVFGRQHISRKNRSLLSGTGHDTTNAKSESVAAVGEWSAIDSNTLFAVGIGTNAVTRKNAFEVVNDGIILLSPNGTRYKLSIDDAGNIVISLVS